MFIFNYLTKLFEFSAVFEIWCCNLIMSSGAFSFGKQGILLVYARDLICVIFFLAEGGELELSYGQLVASRG